jgi:hypothetical protein
MEGSKKNPSYIYNHWNTLESINKKNEV